MTTEQLIKSGYLDQKMLDSWMIQTKQSSIKKKFSIYKGSLSRGCLILLACSIIFFDVFVSDQFNIGLVGRIIWGVILIAPTLLGAALLYHSFRLVGRNLLDDVNRLGEILGIPLGSSQVVFDDQEDNLNDYLTKKASDKFKRDVRKFIDENNISNREIYPLLCMCSLVKEQYMVFFLFGLIDQDWVSVYFPELLLRVVSIDELMSFVDSD